MELNKLVDRYRAEVELGFGCTEGMERVWGKQEADKLTEEEAGDLK